jgi:hypothetical protein
MSRAPSVALLYGPRLLASARPSVLSTVRGIGPTSPSLVDEDAGLVLGADLRGQGGRRLRRAEEDLSAFARALISDRSRSACGGTTGVCEVAGGRGIEERTISRNRWKAGADESGKGDEPS